MAFVDEITLHLKAGDGGHGVVRWLHEKFKEFGGPAGGDGGKGGDVYITPIRNVTLLARYRSEKSFEAERGNDGGSHGMHGANGKDLVLELPLGSVVTNKNIHRSYELLEEGKSIKILEGGLGGKGNKHFKSSTNTRPQNRTFGKNGDEADFDIELRLVADAGLIGLPNAGKSSLLNAITNTKSKVADYPFTTIEPNLGDFFGYIVADIPGLIEGAGEGKGLGYKFLRHVRRTRILVHCISLENENVLQVYQTVRQELSLYDKTLLDKKEIVVLTKTDLVDVAVIEKAEKSLAGIKIEIFKVSILDDGSIKKFSDELSKILESRF